MKIQSLSISGLLTLDLHSLNNEGAEGNAIMTRMVDIVDHNGDLQTVNAVSGDMFKHIQAGHFQALALERGLPLCAGCQVFDANRICADEGFASLPDWRSDTPESLILTKALQTCVLDDAEGILITSEIPKGKKRSIARKSCVEFGWVVGRPEQTRTSSYFHAKYVPEGRGKGSGEAANLGQNIFHRPASSGRYAVVLNVDLYRLGRNDITLELAVSGEDRETRARALLDSVLATLVAPAGAQRNTQNPHILGFEGVVAVSSNSLPAPTVSALNPSYLDEIEKVAEHLNALDGGRKPISLFPFEGLGDFAGIMADLGQELELGD